MSTLPWTEALRLGLPEIDHTHQEFVEMLAHAEAAPDSELLRLWQALIVHTEAHFAQENRWMQQTGFSSTGIHMGQHHAVLQAMRGAQALGEQGQWAQLRSMVSDLAAWFGQHAQIMDAAMALHLRGFGYSPDTGHVHLPAKDDAPSLLSPH